MTLEEEFYTFVQRTHTQKRAFEHNWPYILQATRNGLRVVRAYDSIAYFTQRYEDAPDSPTVIVNALGPHRTQLILAISHQEAHAGRTVIVKNVDTDELPWWRAQGFLERTEAWSNYSYRDDNSFPQYNYSRHNVLSYKFRRNQRRRIRFFESAQIRTEPYMIEREDDVRALLTRFAHFLETKKVETAHEVIRGHEFFFDQTIQHALRLQHTQHGVLIGISFITPIHEMAYYNMVVCENISNLLGYLVYCSMRFVCVQYPHIQFFGAQGSETNGQDAMKRGLNPSEVITKTHLLYSVKAIK